jgi:hypothetical protein
MDAFKPKRPIPIGPVVEANIMPLPKVEPLYAKLPETRKQRGPLDTWAWRTTPFWTA